MTDPARGGSSPEASVVRRIMEAMRTEAGPSGVCPLCGWTIDDYRATELVGCGLCYSALGIEPHTTDSPM